MIRTMRELEQFYLVTVAAPSVTYRVLLAMIPKIQLLQCIASEHSLRDAGLKWVICQNGWRTPLQKLPSKWAVPVETVELTNAQVQALYPAALDVKFSLRMLEDLELRRPHKLDHVKRMEALAKRSRA